MSASASLRTTAFIFMLCAYTTHSFVEPPRPAIPVQGQPYVWQPLFPLNTPTLATIPPIIPVGMPSSPTPSPVTPPSLASPPTHAAPPPTFAAPPPTFAAPPPTFAAPIVPPPSYVVQPTPPPTQRVTPVAVPSSTVPATQPQPPIPGMPSIQCNSALMFDFRNGFASISLQMPYDGEVTFNLYSTQSVRFTSVHAFDSRDVAAPIGGAIDHFTLTALRANTVIIVQIDGTGVGSAYALTQCTEIATTTTPAPTTATTTRLPTPPPVAVVQPSTPSLPVPQPSPISSGTPTPTPVGNMRNMGCGIGVTGTIGQATTVDMEATLNEYSGRMAMYVNGIQVDEIRAYNKNLNVPLAATYPGQQYLVVAGIQMGTSVRFEIDMIGTGTYYALIQCIPNAQTVAGLI